MHISTNTSRPGFGINLLYVTLGLSFLGSLVSWAIEQLAKVLFLAW